MITRSTNDIPNLPVKSAFLDVSTSGSSTVVAGVPNRRIRVLSVAVISKLANDIKFTSDAVQISSTMPLIANGGFVLPFNHYGWFTCGEGEDLNITLAIASQLGVTITYIEL